ncbi:BapA/Bap/LapF family large adhesin [Sphingobium baderi]|uniref:BapA/Bap/LapF family large adhesin n=1 Tax=Sphingobium baderi TaxID=1332080 RepID=UPI000B18C0D6|nr:BapA/Bap/LapF family large adhesin [Sphingobium baderi]
MILLDLGGLTQAIFDSAPRVSFTVQENHSADATFEVSTNALLGLFNGAEALVQVKDASGNWTNMTSIGQNGLIDLVYLGGEKASITFNDLPAGEYRIMGAATGITGLTLVNVKAAIDYFDHTTVGGYDAESVSGNVTDNDAPGTTVTEVNGVTVPDGGSETIHGAYGDLIINSDGSYTYTPNDTSGSGIGQVDQFTYTVQDGSGQTGTATLYVQIDSDGQGLIWSEDLTQSATLEMNATDNGGNAVIDSAYLVESGGPSGSGTASVAGGFGSTSATVTRTFTVGENEQASIKFTASSPDVGQVAGGIDTVNDKLTVTIDGPDGYHQVLTGAGGALLGIGGLGIDQILSDLGAGSYTVTASYTTPTRPTFGGTLSLSFAGQSVTHLDEFVTNGTHPATGNVLADDTLGSSYTKFLVDDGTGTFVKVDNGTTIEGDHGTLTINSDGSYSYQPHSDLGDINGVDEFAYRLEHPNGTVEEASLDISIGHGDGPYDPPVAMLLADSIEFDDGHADDGQSDHPTHHDDDGGSDVDYLLESNDGDVDLDALGVPQGHDTSIIPDADTGSDDPLHYADTVTLPEDDVDSHI